MTCVDCRFWLKGTTPDFAPDDLQQGECHRRAPAPAFDLPLIVARIQAENGDLSSEAYHYRPDDVYPWSSRCSAWPVTMSDTFCGDFAPAKQVSFV